MNSVERVKAICKERKIAISKLERELGFSNGYIGQLKKGTFPADRLVKIANYLAVPTDYLLTGEETKKSPSKSGEGDHAIDYVDDELKEYLDELHTRPEMRMLFSTTKNATKAQIEAIVKFIEGLEKGK